tara:strand:+ start:301 stop:588 length:288 start_codon:yes stop_codon:yes gene_type:complete
MRVRWLALALRDLEGITDYIAQDNPGAALRMADRIELCVQRLERHPEQGRAGRVSSTRELVVTSTPYLVVYRLNTQSVDILRVLHGAQQWPPGGS